MKKKIIIILIILILLFCLLHILTTFYKRKEYVLITNFEISKIINQNNNEEKNDKVEDYTFLLYSILNSNSIKEYVKNYYKSMYNIDNKNISFEINNIKSKYQIIFLCEELDKDNCQLTFQKLISKMITEFEVNYNLAINKTDYQFKNR